MKILWLKTDFLHPTTRGGQIRTLELLRRLRRRHEIHYLAYEDGANREALERAIEYCAYAYAVPHRAPEAGSLRYLAQLAGGLLQSEPVAITRWRSERMRRRADGLIRQERFDTIVCDFLVSAGNLSDLADAVLFQHNVEAVIWRRHAEHAESRLRRWYFQLQAERMERYEKAVCQTVRKVIAVSKEDAQAMSRMYGVERIAWIPTGVDVEYFRRRGDETAVADLVFLGSMDWLPNIDAVEWFAAEILPLIRRRRSGCTVAVVGRRPAAQILELARRDPLIRVTGTVEDVRPYLFGGRVSIVPLRVGGGTRLKIYEAMAAGIPVVSTRVGAEGLDVADGETLYLADTPQEFAERCLRLLEDEREAQRIAGAARELVSSHYSWEAAAAAFERALF